MRRITEGDYLPTVTVRKNRDSGFSLIELIVTVAIIGIIAAIAFAIFLNAQDNSRQAAVEASVSMALAPTQEEVLRGELEFDEIFDRMGTENIQLSLDEETVLVARETNTLCIQAEWVGEDNVAKGGEGCDYVHEEEEEEEEEVHNSLITTWRIESEGDTITLPLQFSGEVEIAWGEDIVETYTSDNPESPELEPDDYEIEITPNLAEGSTIDRFGGVVNTGFEDSEKIISVDQWPTGPANNITDTSQAFRATANLEYIAAPPTTVTNMQSMFFGSSFDQDLSDWDVSNVDNMRAMFRLTENYNNGGRPLTWFSEESTTYSTRMMDSMFYEAKAFNQDITGWDVSNVESMNSMFRATPYFNQDIGEWDVSGVGRMNSMFRNASVFEQNLSEWDVSYVAESSNFATGSKLAGRDLLLPKFED